jgi:hypothetical protein
MRKPRPPHRARRAHGPAAAFAGYKNVASPIARSFPSFLPFQQPQSLHLRGARCSRFMRIRPFCLEFYPFPSGSPDRATQLRRPRRRGAGQLQPESAIAPAASMLLSSYDADPLTGPPRIGRVTSSTASRPSRNLPRRRTITASHCSALRRLRGRGTRPALVAAQQPVAEMPRDDAAWLPTWLCPRCRKWMTRRELPGEFPPCRSTCRIRLDCVALG